MGAVLEPLGPKVAGYCPMGCGQTLHLDTKGAVRCFEYHCANNRAVHVLLADAQIDHVVSFTADSWTVKHPLRERLDDQLLGCTLGQKVAEYLDHLDTDSVSRADRPAGTFRAWQSAEDARLAAAPWHLEPIV